MGNVIVAGVKKLSPAFWFSSHPTQPSLLEPWPKSRSLILIVDNTSFDRFRFESVIVDGDYVVMVGGWDKPPKSKYPIWTTRVVKISRFALRLRRSARRGPDPIAFQEGAVKNCYSQPCCLEGPG